VTVILVRHGESAGNAGGVITGTQDVPLTEAGRAQAERVAARLAGAGVDAVYASTLSRAVDTAGPLAAALGLEVRREHDLCERCWGEAQGLAWPEIRSRWGVAAYEDLRLVPGMESLEAVRERCWRAFAALLDRHRDTVAVCVSHGGAIGQIVAEVVGLPAGVPPGIRVANASITTVHGPSSAPVLAGLNDVCHLSRTATA
jgi:probable phosphoglycerate mutase